jgi:hypothetical protein
VVVNELCEAYTGASEMLRVQNRTLRGMVIEPTAEIYTLILFCASNACIQSGTWEHYGSSPDVMSIAGVLWVQAYGIRAITLEATSTLVCCHRSRPGV